MIVFKDWLESTAFIHEDFLAQTNSKFQSREEAKKKQVVLSKADDSTKPKKMKLRLKDGHNAIWSCEKFNSMKLNERRENVQKLRLCFNCLRPGHRSEDCKKRTFSVPNCGRQHNKLLHSNFSKEATTAASDATTAVATMITQGGLPVVRIKLVNEGLRLSVLAMFDTGSSISFVDKSIVSTLQLQGQKTNLSLAGIHGSQDAKTEIVPIAVSAHEKFRPLTTLKFYVHEKLKLGGQIVDLQGFKDRYPHLKNLQNESYNLNEVQVVLGQDCYEIHHPLELKKSNNQNCTMGSEINNMMGL